MTRVLFYGAFQAIAGQTEIEVALSEPSALSKVIDELVDRIPALEPALFIRNAHAIRPEVLVLHNSKLVRELTTKVLVSPDDEVVIMHQIAGG